MSEKVRIVKKFCGAAAGLDSGLNAKRGVQVKGVHSFSVLNA